MLRGALLACFLLVTAARSQDLTSSYDVQTLSELSIAKLLRVRHQFELAPITLEVHQEGPESRADDAPAHHTKGPPGPAAMALRRRAQPWRKADAALKRGGWEDEKGKKVGSIFQTSITTLAFLAFGGYLLCLVVQSLKAKGGKSKIIVITSSTVAPVTMAAFRRRRRRRRPVRIRRPQRQKRAADGAAFAGPTVDMAPHVDAEAMLDALVSLSEAYTRYHTVDYRRVNQTVIHF